LVKLIRSIPIGLFLGKRNRSLTMPTAIVQNFSTVRRFTVRFRRSPENLSPCCLTGAKFVDAGGQQGAVRISAEIGT
jgi:hypothetical protein